MPPGGRRLADSSCTPHPTLRPFQPRPHGPGTLRLPKPRREAGPRPHRLHGAARNDHRSALLHHLREVHGWVQEQESEAALAEAA